MTEALTVQETITAIMRDVSHVGKDGRNTSQNFNFRGVDAVVNALAAPMRTHGLVVMPKLQKADYREITSGNGKRQAWVLLEVAYTFTGPKGDTMESVVPGEATDFADKATAKAMSVAYRTALLQAFNLPTDEPDPDLDYVERGGEAKPAASKPASKPAAAKPQPEDSTATVMRAAIIKAAEAKGVKAPEVTAMVQEFGGKGNFANQQDTEVLGAIYKKLTGQSYEPPF